MKQYKDYEIDDFLADDNFIRWVQAGSSPADPVWKNLQAAYPEKKADLEKARMFILQMLAGGSLSDEEKSRGIKRILASTVSQAETPVTPVGRRFFGCRSLPLLLFLLLEAWLSGSYSRINPVILTIIW